MLLQQTRSNIDFWTNLPWVLWQSCHTDTKACFSQLTLLILVVSEVFTRGQHNWVVVQSASYCWGGRRWLGSLRLSCPTYHISLSAVIGQISQHLLIVVVTANVSDVWWLICKCGIEGGAFWVINQTNIWAILTLPVIISWWILTSYPTTHDGSCLPTAQSVFLYRICLQPCSHLMNSCHISGELLMKEW